MKETKTKKEVREETIHRVKKAQPERVKEAHARKNDRMAS